jgi:4a-hydroxytetrahydrobiopterin dehydratase
MTNSDRKQKLDAARILQELKDLPGWELREDRLHREYRFPDFARAWAFMSGAALCAQGLNHHPDWSNVYSRVVIDLTTHDAGGVTGMDLELAHKFEELARGFLEAAAP